MRNEPMVRCGDVVIVYDGPRRLMWDRMSTVGWTPSRLWPDSTEVAAVTESINKGVPLLIILDRQLEPVYALVDELVGAPEEVTDLVCSVEGEVVELRVPRLTWLPTHLVERGQRFLREVEATVAHSPTLLLPSLILRSPGESSLDDVWFGLKLRTRHWSIDELIAVLGHIVAWRDRATAFRRGVRKGAVDG